MSSTTVQLRKPRSSGASSSGNKFGRPRSWTEFNTRFHAVSVPIDLTPVPKINDDVIKRREPNEYRKIRPKSASILDGEDRSLKIAGSNPAEGTARPPSPKYTSFMAPNPWRTVVPKPKSPKKSPEKSIGGNFTTKVKTQSTNYEKTIGNYDRTTNDYDVIRNARNAEPADDTCPQANETVGNGSNKTKNNSYETTVGHFTSLSDSESIDSAVVVSSSSSLYGTGSEKSPSRFESRTSGEFDSTSSISDKSSSDFGSKTEDRKFENINLETQATNSKEIENAAKSSSDAARQDTKLRASNFTLDLVPNVAENIPQRSELIVENSKSTSRAKSTTLPVGKQPPPTIVISKSDEDMEFCAEDETYRFGGRSSEPKTGSYVDKSSVPSPLKSCYTPVAIYEDFVEYSDSDNSSVDENSNREMSRSNISSHLGYEGDRSTEEYTPKTTPTPRLRQSFKRTGHDDNDIIDDNNNNNQDTKGMNYDVTCGTWPRRKAKKKGDIIDVEQLMKKFLETRESHLERFKNIYADSRKRIDDVMRGLKETMTQNGYREWYPRVR
uniref:serine-rich adhesin for platelets-like n=1 Tax=Styela clava TaxID=7725 RepID=UPI00193A18F2|nr:serine-rich adhesin for platelets-like [Styela clava]